MALLYCLLAVPIVLMILIFLSDCDLKLKLYEWFGTSPKSRFYGRVVWITGASSGIGEYLAYELAKCGSKLVLSSRRKEELERVKRNCGDIVQPLYPSYNIDQDILVLPMDVTEFDKHVQYTDTVLNHFHKIDILVNNSGRSQRGMVIDTPGLDVENAMFKLNTMAVISLTKSVLPHMVKRKSGHIVVTSSVAGKLGAPMSAVYNATKFALQGYFDGLRIEVYDSNIDVTMICPGPILTNIRDNAFTEDVNVTVKEKEKAAKSSKDNRMDPARCAYLITVGMANKLDELWISINPILFFLYANQYLPNLFNWLSKRLGVKHIMKMREMADKDK
ncbi:dehydrogenase/reductase SDR family member 7 [Exaiptasia diaphana]|uniref:Dehydrogenase/reductase SDR family member 7 n=1 Tax=Exaiptasia diaphana TaxID=2652724 RepID=A0A913XBA0_EXADI|nr:dehydrogenase/reductase SDR family member 7 [Exaiptasia diaphana]KXJ13384.1 Dehydrogenase/reductase SDR family member 7 [Exaiptasia diaphana]